MKLNFANAKAASSTIPAGTLVEARLFVEDLRTSAAGNHFLNVRAEIQAPQQYAGRKTWTNIMLTQNGGAEPAEIGSMQVKATLECSGNDPEANPDVFAFDGFAAVATALHGATAALRLGVEDTPAGAQRNVVKFFMSPNPASGSHIMHAQLKKTLGEDPAPWPPVGPDPVDALLADVTHALDNPPL